MRIYVLTKRYVTMPEKTDSLGIPRTIYVEPNDLTFGVPIHSHLGYTHWKIIFPFTFLSIYCCVMNENKLGFEKNPRASSKFFYLILTLQMSFLTS